MKGYREIFRFVWPLALGMMNNAVLQFTDRAFLAHESMASLEASLPASMLAYVFLGFFQSVVGYSGTFVAQYCGAKDWEMCRRSYRAGTCLALLSGLVTIAALPFGDLVFETFSNGAEVISRQKAYYGICTAGGVFLFGQMAAQAYFTGLGRTRLVLWVNVIGNLINIAADPILIFGMWGLPKLGMAGAAYATVASTAVQWLILFAIAEASLRRVAESSADALRRNLERPPFRRFGDSTLSLAVRILRFGVPAGVYSVLSSLSFTVFVFFTGDVGHVAAAASNACFSVCYLLFAPMEGFSLGAAALVGQCRGAGDDEGAMVVGTRTVAMGVVLVAVASVLVLVLRHPVLSLYAPADPATAAEFHALGAMLFVLMAFWQVFDAADAILCGALRGAGDTHFVMWWMLFVGFVVWLPLVWAVSVVHNTMPALWSTVIVYAVVICVGSLARWRRRCWRRVSII